MQAINCGRAGFRVLGLQAQADGIPCFSGALLEGKFSSALVPDGCSLQRGGAAECVLYSACSPFVQLLVNLQRPFPPEVPDLMRSGWLCGLENSGGILLPKICCPKAALAQTPPHPFSSHPNIANVASPGKCGDSTTFGKIVGGQVGLRARPPALFGGSLGLGRMAYKGNLFGRRATWFQFHLG